MMGASSFSLPRPARAAQLPFEAHQYLSSACAHQYCAECNEVEQACGYCHALCLCACHRWPVETL